MIEIKTWQRELKKFLKSIWGSKPIQVCLCYEIPDIDSKKSKVFIYFFYFTWILRLCFLNALFVMVITSPFMFLNAVSGGSKPQHELVKLSSRGNFCHPKISSYYKRTINIRKYFNTLEECLDYGGKLPVELGGEESKRILLEQYHKKLIHKSGPPYILKFVGKIIIGVWIFIGFIIVVVLPTIVLVFWIKYRRLDRLSGENGKYLGAIHTKLEYPVIQKEKLNELPNGDYELILPAQLGMGFSIGQKYHIEHDYGVWVVLRIWKSNQKVGIVFSDNVEIL